MTYYKIVDYIDSKRKTLFHGLNGSKIIETGKWLKADIKPVKDGTSKTTYLSGWHIVPTEQECHDYLKKFKNIDNKAIIRVLAKNLRPKAHSPANVYLAEWMKIEEIVWRQN